MKTMVLPILEGKYKEKTKAQLKGFSAMLDYLGSER